MTFKLREPGVGYFPLVVVTEPGRKFAWIEADGRAFYRGFRVPRKLVFFIAAWRMMKTSQFKKLPCECGLPQGNHRC